MTSLPQKIEDNVSRETLAKLEKYQEILLKWQDKINLISPNTINNAWQRHFIDSMQVFDVLPQKNGHLLDMGSGAGFPGLVLAIMGMEHVTLVEADRRKCIFLAEVVRELELENVTIIHERIELVRGVRADIVTARALASLEQLIAWAKGFAHENTTLIFPKGKNFAEEMRHCILPATVEVGITDSQTDAEAKIIRLSGLFLK